MKTYCVCGEEMSVEASDCNIITGKTSLQIKNVPVYKCVSCGRKTFGHGDELSAFVSYAMNNRMKALDYNEYNKIRLN